MQPTDTLAWSPTTHFVPGLAGTAVLDSLYLRPVFLGHGLSGLAEHHRAGASPTEAVRRVAADDSTKGALVDALREAKVVHQFGQQGTAPGDVAASVIDARHLAEIYLVLGGACNFGCSHCLSGSDESGSPFFKTVMDEDTALRAVDLLADVLHPQRANRVVFYGGEPLMRWPLIRRVLAYLRQHPAFGPGLGQMHPKLITNGSLLTPAIAAELADSLAEVVLSFDGPDWLTQQVRPSRSLAPYPVLADLVSMLADHGVTPSLSITVTETTLAHIDAVLDWAADEVEVPMVFCIVKQQEDLLYDSVFAEQVSDAMIAAYRRILAAGGEEQRLNRMINCIRTNTPNVQSCYAQGAQQVVVDQNGRIGVCQGFLEDSKFFHVNLRQPGLSHTLFDSAAMRHWETRMPVNIEPCRHCPSVGVCGGGCPASASKGGKSVYDIDLGHCRTSKKVLPFLLWEVLTDPGLRARFDLPEYATFGLEAGPAAG